MHAACKQEHAHALLVLLWGKGVQPATRRTPHARRSRVWTQLRLRLDILASAILSTPCTGDILTQRLQETNAEPVARPFLQGSDPNSKDWEGDTPLTQAASHGRLNIAELLLERGADPLTQTQAGLAPVHRAAEKGHLPALRLLLTKVPDKLLPTSSGRTLVHVAAGFGQVRCLQPLRARRAAVCKHQRAS